MSIWNPYTSIGQNNFFTPSQNFYYPGEGYASGNLSSVMMMFYESALQLYINQLVMQLLEELLTSLLNDDGSALQEQQGDETLATDSTDGNAAGTETPQQSADPTSD
ncbi:MAG TPA: hypothetical protein PLB10_00640 [Thiolinea sp.]|nr:hypothetical protein [Thiolinea sp.]